MLRIRLTPFFAGFLIISLAFIVLVSTMPRASSFSPVRALTFDPRGAAGIAAPTPINQLISQTQGETPAIERVILQNISLRLIVSDGAASLAQMTALVSEYGGWVVNSTATTSVLTSGDEVTRAMISMRIPVERLGEALEQFKTEAIRVDSESATGEDVTAAYVDASSQLTNLEAAEAQLRQIMEDATDTEAVLSVYNELVRVRGEIETLRGRLNYYDEASAYALVTVEFVPQPIEQSIQFAGWNPGETVEGAVASLLNVLRWVADAAIQLVIVGVPLLLIIWVPLWLIRRFMASRRTS